MNKKNKPLNEALFKLQKNEGEEKIFHILNSLFKNYKFNEKDTFTTFRLNQKYKVNCKLFIFQKIFNENFVELSKSIMLSRAEYKLKNIIPVPVSWIIFLKKNKVSLSFFSHINFI